MKTTVNIDDKLLDDAKLLATQNGKTLSEVIEDSLRMIFAKNAKSCGCPRVKLPRMSGNGLQPGVNLDSNANLIDSMEP